MTTRTPLLSVDVDAQLRKLPARRFQRPEHYLVDWVRGALARGAEKVDIRTQRREVAVVDDGEPIDSVILERLVQALDGRRSDEERRAGLELFEGGDGLEVLAALAPEDAHVSLESGRGEERSHWRLSIGLIPQQLVPQHEQGTHLVVRRSGSAKAEREALAEYVRFARAAITVNGTALPSGPPEDALAYARIVAGDKAGHIWIPARGDTCRLWSTEYGIRLRQRLLPAQHGLIFHAAVEGAEEAAGPVVDALRREARKLYELLAQRYRSLSPDGRGRTDELLFQLHRGDAPWQLIDAFRIFRLAEDAAPVNLSTVLRTSGERGEMYALRLEEPAADYDLEGRSVLRLSAAQWDFLVDRIGIKLVRPPGQVKRRWRGRLRIRQTLARLRHDRAAHLALKRTPGNVPDGMTELERVLGDHLSEPAGIEWLPGKGPLPAVSVAVGGRRVWRVFCAHPEVVQAAQDLAHHPGRAQLWANRLLRGDTRGQLNPRPVVSDS